MVAFLRPAKGGILPINGKNGSIINSSAIAQQGKPGREVIPHPINRINAGTQITLSVNNCDPQSQLQKAQQKLQQQMQQIIEQQIIENVKEGIAENANIQQQTQDMQQLQERQTQGEDVSQQIEIAEKEAQAEFETIIQNAITKASQQLPQIAKVANSTAAGLKPIAPVAESLSTFVPSQGVNMGNYGRSVKNVQTVSQSCFV